MLPRPYTGLSKVLPPSAVSRWPVYTHRVVPSGWGSAAGAKPSSSRNSTPAQITACRDLSSIYGPSGSLYRIYPLWTGSLSVTSVGPLAALVMLLMIWLKAFQRSSASSAG